MVVKYCGYCGAAARPQVRFCRQCGAELEVGAEGTSAPLSSPVEVGALPATGSSRSLKADRAQETAVQRVNGHSEPRKTNTSAALSVPLNGTNGKSQPLAPAKKTGKTGKTGNTGRQPRASALAQASGLEGASAFSSRMRSVLLLVAVMIVGVASLIYYRQSILSLRVDRPERNLVTPEEQSLDLIRLGKQSYEFGQYEKAIANFKEAIALTPQHTPIYLLLAQSYQASGQVDEALRSYWTLLRQDPKNLEARLEVAEVHRARGNWREAYQEYQRIIDINSQSLEAIAALAVIEAHDQRPFGPDRGDLSKYRAVTRHRMASLAPTLPGTGLTARLAPSTPQGGSLSAPPNLLVRPADDERGDVRAMAAAHKTLGNRFHNVREFVAAIKEFSISQRLTPEDKDLYYLLGSCYDGLDQDALAHEFYKQCDSGPYAQVARSAAQKTAKAARNQSKQDSVSEIDPSSSGRSPAHGLK